MSTSVTLEAFQCRNFIFRNLFMQDSYVSFLYIYIYVYVCTLTVLFKYVYVHKVSASSHCHPQVITITCEGVVSTHRYVALVARNRSGMDGKHANKLDGRYSTPLSRGGDTSWLNSCPRQI